jgi:hypothetical protein
MAYRGDEDELWGDDELEEEPCVDEPLVDELLVEEPVPPWPVPPRDELLVDEPGGLPDDDDELSEPLDDDCWSCGALVELLVGSRGEDARLDDSGAEELVELGGDVVLEESARRIGLVEVELDDESFCDCTPVLGLVLSPMLPVSA